MDAIEILEEQHREAEDLFAQTEECRDESEKQALFEELADALAIHAALEEAHFYPAIRMAQTEDLVLESLDEHRAVKGLIAELLGIGVTHELFDEKLETLKEQVEHHVEEEETSLFPKARKVLGDERLESIAIDMAELQDELEEMSPRDNLRSEYPGVHPGV